MGAMTIENIYWIILLVMVLIVLGVLATGGETDAVKELQKFFGIIETVKQ